MRLVLEEKPLAEVPPEATRRAMLQGLRELGLAALAWDRDARDLQARIEFVRAALGREAGSAWPAVERCGSRRIARSGSRPGSTG